ncbi:choline kinase [Alteromonas aestuariivivens]|uniref:Choline kinase n=1 Tax=Alteromonas aestuariivivens TaxID=1938339 RepID=A0A3D8M7J7_9ALTE|nr:phosphotransferase [Alteromonas aestuariivivens]RDV25142.1 choline kinase [Alteromonas aestuariivivens]
MLPKALTEPVTQVLGLSPSAQWSQMESGAVNRVWRLKDGEGDWVVKWLGGDNFSGLDRNRQFGLQQQLARLGLAPAPIWKSADASVWVEKWAEPKRPSCLVNNEPALVAGRVLATIHQQQIDAEVLDLPGRWQHYIELAQLGRTDPIRHVVTTLTQQWLEQDKQNYVLCHNDLSFGHIVDDMRPCVVDWEYAALGNRFFDLASCSLINNMTERQQRQMEEEYARSAQLSAQWVGEQLASHLPIVQLTTQLWFKAMQRTSGNAVDAG